LKRPAEHRFDECRIGIVGWDHLVWEEDIQVEKSDAGVLKQRFQQKKKKIGWNKMGGTW